MSSANPSSKRKPAKEVRPSSPRSRPHEIELEPDFDRLTHYLFRYPAKFHPPVARALLERFSSEGDLVLDPFCGSGTLLVEAAVTGRRALGVDIDPLAVLVSQVKCHRYDIPRLRRSAERVLDIAMMTRRNPADYSRLMFRDIGERPYKSAVKDLVDHVPDIPNLLHWFRRYVVVDLAQISAAITGSNLPPSHRRFMDVVFASIVRNVSQADPVPVSGLEVTKWMRDREVAGRMVDPHSSFEAAMTKALNAVGQFTKATRSGTFASARHGDATELGTAVPERVDTVITSPPYHGAVDYYRRHQLEMFWLGLTKSQDQRLELLQHYVGRPHVPARHRWVTSELETSLARSWHRRIAVVSPKRADSFKHYMVAMSRFFDSLGPHVKAGGTMALVVGHSTWNDAEIPTTALFKELAGRWFDLEDVLTYPVRNRYMSYSRKNAASIDREYVLVMRRRESRG